MWESDDWSFILKLHAIMECALTRLLEQRLAVEKMDDIDVEHFTSTGKLLQRRTETEAIERAARRLSGFARQLTDGKSPEWLGPWRLSLPIIINAIGLRNHRVNRLRLQRNLKKV
jgi:hypothetical protein